MAESRGLTVHLKTLHPVLNLATRSCALTRTKPLSAPSDHHARPETTPSSLPAEPALAALTPPTTGTLLVLPPPYDCYLRPMRRLPRPAVSAGHVSRSRLLRASGAG